MLSFLFHAEKAEDGERSDHTYRSRPPPSTPSLQFPRHLCTSLCLQLYNNKALNLRRGVNPSLEKERKRQRKEVEGEKGWVAVEGVAGKRRVSAASLAPSSFLHTFLFVPHYVVLRHNA
ncbi:unnamed protein product [Oreochromis niloticus]|nr:unnamed protein product [Mustela putorius furo]